MNLRAAAAPVRPDHDSGGVASLVERAQRGDQSALAEIYALYRRTVRGILLSRVPRIEVDDLVQDVFVAAMERLPTLRDPAAFPAWLATIARNRATDCLRGSGRTTPLPDDWPVADVDRTEALLVLSAIQSLPEAYSETLTLRLVEGMTGPEIAARTGLTEGSVRVNLHRGMKQLREKLERTLA
jgi:RNA polymerase sigma-70 factor (ECF subfamily)